MKLAGLTVALIILSTGLADAQNWTHWRGPNQNGVVDITGLVDDWSFEPRKNVAWVSDVGGRATPIVLNDRVYLNCRTPHNFNDPNERIHCREKVVCWDAATGEVLWEDEFNVFQTDIPAPRVGWASMCGDEETGNVYVHSVSGLFRCYTPNGEVVWERSLLEDFGKISGYGGRTQTPIIDEDRVIVSFLAVNWGDTKGPGPKHTYYAFDKRTGELQWTSAPGGPPQDTNYSVPFVTVIDGVRMLIGGNGDGNLYAMNARTGEPLWSFRLSLRGLNTTPVSDGNYVYIAHGEDNIDSREFGRVQCIDATGRGDITDTHGVWRVDGIKAGYTALLVKDGILYVVSDTGNLYAFDSQNGDALWTHNLGTVGKGSPVWADGKLYIMEVNGRVHILRPSRDKCESLSQVTLHAANGNGLDEIYASPAISNGRVFLVTRDRTICLAAPNASVIVGSPEPMAPEKDPGKNVAVLQLRPFEVALNPGEEVEFMLHAFDENGRFIEATTPQLTADEGLAGLQIEGNRIRATNLGRDIAGKLTATKDGKSATARVRVFNGNPRWEWDFEGYAEGQVPPTWIRAFGKLKPTQVDGGTAMKVDGFGSAPGRPSHYVWLGDVEMKDYSVQADILLKEEQRRLSNIGVTANRYNFIIKGNTGKIAIQTWPAHLRLGAEKSFRSDPDIWYRMKISVDVQDDGAHVSGKVWPRDEPEPDPWTLEVVDPHPNTNGSPGLYVYALADCYFDNIIVSRN